ncbi:hypothetical protein VNO78_17913 [Psophocarpus tetragonolobus]|uniref:Uncharacterized protein n=1 Tax=Psophocarpus tetragonolobus TaxID=3891 RepID=A0AAN9SIE0_PSOTE
MFASHCGAWDAIKKGNGEVLSFMFSFSLPSYSVPHFLCHLLSNGLPTLGLDLKISIKIMTSERTPG